MGCWRVLVYIGPERFEKLMHSKERFMELDRQGLQAVVMQRWLVLRLQKVFGRIVYTRMYMRE